MLYLWLRRAFPGMEPLERVSLQAGVAALFAFALSLAIGRFLIWFFTQRGVVEDVAKPDSETLDRLHRGKKNTPTMGGLMILLAVIVSTLLWADVRNTLVLISLFLLLSLGAVGFMDDHAKLRRRPKRGIRAKTKLLLQLTIGLLVGIIFWRHSRDLPGGARLCLPFLDGDGVHLGGWIVVVTMLLIAGMSNAVNLTDGLDSLAGGCVTIAALLLGGLAYVVGHGVVSGAVGVVHVPEAGALAILCASVAGATLAFLWFNSHPAQIFMGDVGSLPLGGLVGFLGVALRQEALMLLLGCVFIAELFSVILQVGGYKLTGKRIFRCAPLHHHFEFAGWSETKVTVRFWIVMVVVAMCAMALFRVH